MSCCGYWAFLAPVLLFVVYKLIDRLLRLPTVGRPEDRYVLITGCSSGFGHDLARRLDSRGCHVFAGVRNEKAETELKKVCSSRLVTLFLDVAKPDSVRKAFQTVKDRLEKDGKELWAVVNNAGTVVSCGPPEWQSVDDYRTTAAVNLYGLIDVTMSFLPLVKKSRGRVVNMSSSSGRYSDQGLAAYCVSKYGVEAFTDGLRRSLRPFGCKAVLIEPGYYETSLTTLSSARRLIQNTWDRASPEAKDEYGEEYFRYWRDVAMEKIDRLMLKREVYEVTDAYEHAIFGRNPRARYIVGLDSHLLVRLMQSLPEWLGDWIMERLDSELPLPAAVTRARVDGGK